MNVNVTHMNVNVTQMNADAILIRKSRHTHECVMSHVTHMNVNVTPMNVNVTHMNVNVTHMNVNVTHMNVIPMTGTRHESCHTYECHNVIHCDNNTKLKKRKSHRDK